MSMTKMSNILFKPIEWIGDHITDNGWDPLYTVWDKQGELALPTPPLQANYATPLMRWLMLHEHMAGTGWLRILHVTPTSFGCGGCFINRGRPIEIGFEDRADNTVVPTGPYSTQWGNYFGEMIRSIPLYHPSSSWQKVPAGHKARLMATLGSTYNLEPHMRSERWPRIEGYIQAQFGKSYNTNKATLKREHWIRDPETRAYDLDRIRRGKPDEYTDDEWRNMPTPSEPKQIG
ncbi:hypothetical protein Tco_0103185 [Tanacetum coccineum]